VRTSLPHWALVLALTLAALPQAGSAGVKQASLSPLFDTTTRFKPKKTFRLRFRVQSASGAPVPKDDVMFTLQHGIDLKEPAIPLHARLVKSGVFEIPFSPEGPGQYRVFAAVRGTQAGSIAPVRLGVVGAVGGFVEVSPEKDAEMQARARNAGWRSKR
jgi:hypothetical protein